MESVDLSVVGGIMSLCCGGTVVVTDNELMQALKIVVGEPELVIVDARVLRLLMGDLANLIILAPDTTKAMSSDRNQLFFDEGPFAWDGDEFPCTEN